MTSHFEESIITGTREMSGSVAMMLRNFDHRRLAVEHGFVHVDINDLGAVGDLLPRHFDGAGVVVVEDQPGKGARAGDVGSFADVDKQGVRADFKWFEARGHDAVHARILADAALAEATRSGMWLFRSPQQGRTGHVGGLRQPHHCEQVGATSRKAPPSVDADGILPHVHQRHLVGRVLVCAWFDAGSNICSQLPWSAVINTGPQRPAPPR